MYKKLFILLVVFFTNHIHTKNAKAVRPTAPLTVPVQSATAACCCGLKPPTGCLGSIAAGIIEMPNMDSISGSGPGFNFVADDTGVLQITFHSLVQPVVTATVENSIMPLTIQIINRSNNSVTLAIDSFNPAQQTFVNFHAIELHCNS